MNWFHGYFIERSFDKGITFILTDNTTIQKDKICIFLLFYIVKAFYTLFELDFLHIFVYTKLIKSMKKKLLVFALIALLWGCEDDKKQGNAKLNSSSVELKFGQTKQLSVEDGVVKSWTSDDEFVAFVDKKGLVTAMHIGKTNIQAFIDGQMLGCEVTVNPTYNSFKEPLTTWGASVSAIKSAEKRTLIAEEFDGIDGALGYEEPRTILLAYFFRDYKLESSAVLLALTFNAEELATFLSERYEILGETDDGIFVWASKDRENLVGVEVDEQGFFVMYMPYTIEKSPKVINTDKFKQMVSGSTYSELDVEQAKVQLRKLIGDRL